MREKYVPGLTQSDIDTAKELILKALQPRVLTCYSDEEIKVLAILEGYISLLQQAKAKRSKGEAKTKAAYRRDHVNMLLRYVVNKKYRKNPNTDPTVMEIINWLDEIGIEASVSQVRRDIHAALKSGPLPTK
jgi:hypothetical protein